MPWIEKRDPRQGEQLKAKAIQKKLTLLSQISHLLLHAALLKAPK